jgi:hypothetical protein
MQTGNVSQTQPASGFAYSGIKIVDGQPRQSQQVVYRGYIGGRHVVNDGAHDYHATRTSKDGEEPVFSFNTADKVH